MEALFHSFNILVILLCTSSLTCGNNILLTRCSEFIGQMFSDCSSSSDVLGKIVNGAGASTWFDMDTSILKDPDKLAKFIAMKGIQLVPFKSDTKELLSSNIEDISKYPIAQLASSAGIKWLAIDKKTNKVISPSSFDSIIKNIQDFKSIHQSYSEGNVADVVRKLADKTNYGETLDAWNSKDPKKIAKVVGENSKFLPVNRAVKEVISRVTGNMLNNDTSTNPFGRKELSNIAIYLLSQGLISYATFGLLNPASSSILGLGGNMLASALTSKLTSKLFDEKVENLTNTGLSDDEALTQAMQDLYENGHEDFNDEPKVNLGCYLNNDYSRKGYIQTAFYKRKQKWESSSNIMDMKFNNTDSLKQFITDLNEISASVMGSTSYNDLDQLLSFIMEFKNRGKKDLARFYDSYQYKFRPHEDTAVFEMKLIHRLKKKYPSTANHFYLATAYMDVPKEYTESYQSSLKEYYVPRNFFHAHVAGVMNISLMFPNEKPRRGLILMDLSLGLEKPIILMEDKKWPHYDTTMRGYGKKIKYSFEGPRNSYVVASIQEKGKILSNHLYYVKKPFCSFLEVTFKPNLIIPTHGMMTRRSNGFKKAQVNFRILPTHILKRDFYFNVATFNENNGEGIGRRIPFAALDNMSNAEMNAVDLTATGLGVPRDVLLGKLFAIKLTIFNDSKLVEDIYNLNRQLNYVDEPQSAPQQTPPDLGEDGKPEDNLVSQKTVQNLFYWGKKNFVNPWTEKRDNFLSATVNQNEFVKKTHITNAH